MPNCNDESVRNCIALGSGRGGTSLLAGTVVRAGYYGGANLYEPRESNPTGFFEDPEINTINEKLLEPVAPELIEGHRWLAELPLDAPIPLAGDELDARIRAETANVPFCFKDPRFCYTLDAWRPHLGDAVYLCVFRPPRATARSMVREVASQPYLASLRDEMTEERALGIWLAMYRWVLEKQALSGEWLFLHYDQLLDRSAIPAIERMLGTAVDREFADPGLNRSSRSGDVPAEVRDVYRELCDRARYRRPGPLRRRLGTLSRKRPPAFVTRFQRP